MRHFSSILLALILTPAIYALGGIGTVEWSKASVGLDPVNHVHLAIGLVAVVAGGLLYAVLVLARLSPLGPVLSGLALFGVAVWATVAANSFARAMPQNLAGAQHAGWALAGPIGGLLAVPLIATIASPRRWRRYANPPVMAYPAAPAYPGTGIESPYPGAGGSPVQAGYGEQYPAQPSSGGPSYPPPSYPPPPYPPPPYGSPPYLPPGQPGSTDPNTFDPETTRRL